MGYARPTDLSHALELIAGGGWTVLAGGTDLYPATTAQELAGDILDISALGELRGISEAEGHWRIGARTTWTDLIRTDLPPAFHALQLAAREVGGVQIQNCGTVAGNLCHASPAADGVPPLMVLDAKVELASVGVTRTLPLDAFLTGPRTTARAQNELVVAITVPKAAVAGRSAFVKLGARKYLVISIAMTAARLLVRDGRVEEAAIAVGACSPVTRRLPLLEKTLVGQPVADLSRLVAAGDVADALSPIDDVRASAGYRAEAAAELVRRTLREVTGAGS